MGNLPKAGLVDLMGNISLKRSNSLIAVFGLRISQNTAFKQLNA